MLNIVDPNAPAAPSPELRKTDLLGLPREALLETLAPVIDRPFRAGQIYDALYRRAVSGFDQITELPRELRERLDERFRIGWPEIETRALSTDGTCKYLFRVEGAASIEAVDIPDRDRRTFCVSSQAGCGLACAFCVTGFWGAGRNLTAGEILAQVLAIRADRGLPPEGLNLVFMGMGEPLLNIDNVKTAIDILTEWISPRRITLSTAGVLPGIEALAGWEKRPNLAISLHAPDDERRSRIMPINRTYPLADLLAALRRFPLEKGRKITFEYILIRDFNDSEKDADQLAKTLRGVRAKVNLIPMNPDPVLGEAMVPPSDEQIDRFQKRLMQRDLIATVRRRRGDDVSAACGQLRAFGRDPRGFPKKLAEQRALSPAK
ncbi:MAG TPA: 23S rRNA (adenine(2503)-C(2))-methyltransferase RlmN [Thermoanaerobaculia bacterium]|jgi:23S rRNA (adenine2503-C2)-methyltransferase|nr:23S rRNA (adenine(2503)-C(2))-methyltransferase RlmN [Thermoanaerobaculia bacterium]